MSHTLLVIIWFRLQLSEIFYFWIIEHFSESSNLYSTKCFLFSLKCTKIVGDWGSAPDHITWSLFHTPFTPKVTSGASTKLCICQCKQMSFQLPFESTCISKFLESRRKIIPCFRSGIREASLTELALHCWKFISESVRRSESSSAGQIGGRRYNVGQVGWSTANMHQMHKYAQFKRYAKLNW